MSAHTSRWGHVRTLCACALALLLILLPASSATPAKAAAPAACARIERDAAGVARWLEYCGALDAAGDPETVARGVLAAHAADLGLRPDGRDLTLLAVQPTGAATHVRFAQTYQGVPVYLGQVLVQYTPAGAVQLINNHTVSGIAVDTAPAVAGEAADALALARSGGAVRLRQPLERTLVIYGESGAPVLAWHVVARVQEPLGDLHFMVSATSGELLADWDEIWEDSGTGLVFAPNAVQSSGNTALRDNNDATSAALNAARTQVTLTHLLSTTYKLAGSFVDVTAPGVTGCSLPYVPGQANEPTRVYSYTRDLDTFEEATTYAAIDGVQSWIQALGYTNANNRPVPVDVHCIPDDNSYYSDGDHALHFGDGGVDDAEDADIVVHEYGHATQDNQVPGWGPGGNTEQRAQGEGFGDFLPSMYYIGMGDPTYLSSYRYCVGEWDATSYNPVTTGNAGSGCLRWIDGRNESNGNDLGMYPGVPTEEHNDGRFWSAALTCMYEGMGATPEARDNMMKLVIQHHFSLTPDSSTQAFERAVAALILADQNLFGGTHQQLISQCALRRGLITAPAMPAPVLTYPTGGEVITPGSTISVTWNANGAPVTTTYQIDYTDECTLPATFADDVENGINGWTASHAGGSLDWTQVITDSHSPTHSWFAGDEASTNDQRLVSPAIVLGTRDVLSFWHRYDLQSAKDGGVVEISTNNGSSWSDLGPRMTQNAYNGTIVTTSPLIRRWVFTGNSGGWIETRADLSGYAGKTIKLRFRQGDDASTGVTGGGWWIDDIVVRPDSAWTPLADTEPGATSISWQTPMETGTDHCVRIQGWAAGYRASPYDASLPFALADLPHRIALPAAFLNANAP